MMLAHSKAKDILSKKGLRRSNLGFLKTKVSSSKQNLFVEPDSYYSLNWDLRKLLEERYGKSIDRAVKKMVKARVRVINIADKVPLVQHIERPNRLKGQAKKDLEKYIVDNIGV